MPERGMSFAERQSARQRIRERAFADAEHKARTAGLTMRCERAMALEGASPELISAEHRACRGESPGGAGCLCECHDNPGVTITEASGD